MSKFVIECPVCGKWLFDAEIGTKGVIKAFCKRCKTAKEIKLGGNDK